MNTYHDPEAAESAFYRAIEDADIETMMSVWDASDDIACIHPLGSRLNGIEQIRQSWRQMFASGTRLRFRISAVRTISDGSLLSVRLVHENITVLGVDEQPTQPIIATNIYRKGLQGWRLILHHASPGSAAQRPQSATFH